MRRNKHSRIPHSSWLEIPAAIIIIQCRACQNESATTTCTSRVHYILELRGTSSAIGHKQRRQNVNWINAVAPIYFVPAAILYGPHTIQLAHGNRTTYRND